MSAMQGALSAAERSMRSVFVGNIPYEATEEQLKDIFSEVGPVVSFRLVYDRETGKPKGYGFCEYKDQEMALSAMRNLNGYELNGRALRVDNAASEKSKEELKNLQASLGGPPVESPYGPEVPPEKAPDAIAHVVASLPPEQLYELMTQIKACIENNPNEARNLLIQNPQLSYAIVQALVVMGIIDSGTGASMFHKPTKGPAPPAGLLPTPDVNSVHEPPPPVIPGINDVPASFPATIPSGPPVSVAVNSTITATRTTVIPPSRPSLLGDRPPTMPSMASNQVLPNQYSEREGPRVLGDRDLRQAALIDRDMRAPPVIMGDKDMRQPLGDEDLRPLSGIPNPLPENRPYDPRYRGMPRHDMGNRGAVFDRPRTSPNIDPRSAYDERVLPPNRIEDPRNSPMTSATNVPPARMPPNPRIAPAASASPVSMPSSNPVSSPRQTNPYAATAAAIAPHDQEKAALIVQVLQLSDEQIAMLPPEQRQSIMVLKEQISRSQR